MTLSPPTWKWSELRSLQDIQMLSAPCLQCFLGGVVGTARGQQFFLAGLPELFLICIGL